MKTIVRPFHEVTGTFFELWHTNRIVQSALSRLERSKPRPNYGKQEHPLLSLHELLVHLQREHDRRRIIEDKAKTNVLGITLAFSAILASVALMPRIVEAARHSPDWAIWAFIGLQLLAIVFLLIGGWLALRALRIAEIHVWTLADERSNTTSEERNATIGWYIQKDQLISTLKANNLDASYSCIRNGVLVLALAAALALILIAFSEPPAAGTEEEGAIRRSPKVGIVVPQTDRVEQLQKATRSWSYLPHSMPQHNAASRC